MLSSLIALASLFGIPPQTCENPSYLFKMTDRPLSDRGELYCPRAGDIVLFDDHSPVMAKLYRCCGTAAPLHAGILFRKPDGKFAILEAGTNAVMKVFVFDLEPRFKDFDGTILVRCVRQPLTEEQSHRLTDFAVAQEGKPYAIGRLIMHGLTQRARGAIRADFLGRTVVDRDRWICSELVVASAVAAGILNGDDYPANVMYPRDLAYDERFDLSPFYAPTALWYPRSELERVGNGVRVGNR